MQLEIQVALNFFISFMYNKLPRRRVNIFGEELEKALRCKFQSHWYPDNSSRGSAYRCLRTGTPVDPVLEIAARESGLDLNEIRDNLPAELSVWIDPGEVSYRIGEKGQVKILYSEQSDNTYDQGCDGEVRSLFGSAAGVGCGVALPIDLPMDPAMTPSSASSSVVGSAAPTDELSQAMATLLLDQQPGASDPATLFSPGRMDVMVSPSSGTFQTPSSSLSAFPAHHQSVVPPPSRFNHHHHHQQQQPLTFTTAAFAQTKFGSTKLKSNGGGKRSSRMSPTEFSNYIKQRALMQQQQQQQQQQQYHALTPSSDVYFSSSGGRDHNHCFPLQHQRNMSAQTGAAGLTFQQSPRASAQYNSQQLAQAEPHSMLAGFYDPLLGNSCGGPPARDTAAVECVKSAPSVNATDQQTLSCPASQRHHLLVAN